VTVAEDSGLPTGTVTFVFTDIGGSTRLFRQTGARWPALLARHDHLLTAAFDAGNGRVLSHDGDGYFVAFQSADDAVRAVVQAQRSMLAEPWPADAIIRVRAGVHTGYAIPRDGDYVALAVHQAARVAAAAHPGQTLLTEPVLEAMSAPPPVGVVAEPLGMHRLKDFEVAQGLFELRLDGAEPFPPLSSLWRGANNLPLPRTSFVGRAHDQEQVRALLTASRLVTIVGTGGAGKTRLATQVAAGLLDGTGDGVWLVELAGVADAPTVPLAVTRTLNLPEDTGREPLDSLVDRLQAKRLLIILDNCEHLIDACAELADTLLARCAGIHILATSRQPLNVAGEQLYRLEPLGTPPDTMAVNLDEATRFEAIELFAERASLHNPRFVLDDDSLPAVSALCRRLEGLPLALELAAARLRTLPVEVVASRLDDQMDLLVGSQRGVEPRQRTVAAAIDWSFGLLTAAEQQLLVAQSVHRGWSLDAAVAVAADDLDRGTVELLLDSLVEQSLVQAESVGGEVRYSLLEPTRQYAERRRRADADADAAAVQRHMEFYLDLCETARREIYTTQQRRWLEQLDLEDANLQAARDAALADPAGATLALRFTAALASYWVMRGRVVEGLRYADRALEGGDHHRVTTERAEATVGTAAMLTRAGQHGRARELLTTAAAAFEALGNARGRATALNDLAWLASRHGNLDHAVSLAETAQTLISETDEPQLAGRIHATLGDVAERRGDLDRSRAEMQRSQQLFDQVGDRIGSAKMLNNLGLLDLMLGDYAAGRRSLEACLTLFSEMQDAASLPTVLVNLGLIAVADRDVERGTELFTQGLRLGHRMADTELVSYAVLGLAMVAECDGADERAAELHGVTDALLAQLQMELDALEERLRQLSLARLVERHGADAVEAWRETGRRRDIDHTIAAELTSGVRATAAR